MVILLYIFYQKLKLYTCTRLAEVDGIDSINNATQKKSALSNSSIADICAMLKEANKKVRRFYQIQKNTICSFISILEDKKACTKQIKENQVAYYGNTGLNSTTLKDTSVSILTPFVLCFYDADLNHISHYYCTRDIIYSL